MKPTRFELALLLIAAGIIVYQIFVPPLIGLADSGDFDRIIPQSGLTHISAEYDEKYFAHFNSKYRIVQESPVPLSYKTSTSLLVIVARWLSVRAGRDQFFDIRILAALYTLILLFGIWLVLVGSRSLNITLRLVLSSLLVIILTDVGYIAYFNSFYSEGTALVFIVLGVGSSLILITERSSSASSVLLLTAYFLAIAVIITSKPQYIPLVPAFLLLGIYLSKYVRYKWRYLLSGSLAAALCCIAIWYYNQPTVEMKVEAAYIGIFLDLLPHSNTPEQDLAELGLNPKFAGFAGTGPYQADSPLNVPMIREEFSSKVDSYTLPIFYLTHPARFYELCRRCAKHTFFTRIDRLGYYEASSGKSQQTKPFGIWSYIREHVFPRSVFFLCFFFVTCIAAIVFLFRASSPIMRYMYLLYSLFVFIAGAQFCVSVVAAGGEPDLRKHLFMFNLAFDSCLILSVLGIVHLLQTLRPSFLKRLRE